MKKRKLFMALTALTAGVALASCDKEADPTPTPNPDQGDQGNTGGNTETNPLAGTYDVTVWMSELTGVKELTEKQIDAFEAANPGIVINATVEGVSESKSASDMIASVEDGADIYAFAHDQLARLIKAKALNQLGTKASETVAAQHDAGSVSAASVAGNLYCYPLTADNGYFMYYDKSVLSEDKIDTMEEIIETCEAAGKMISFELKNGWYTASYFFGVNTHSNWTTDDDGNFTAVDDTMNSDAGVIALKGMQKLLHSKSYLNSSKASDFSLGTPSAVVVSGTWDATNAKTALGDNLGVAKLPTFTVDGKTYQLGSFSGNKLLGVKPQTDSKKAAVLQQLALWLTNETCQTERFKAFGWGPSNKNAQTSDAVKADPVLSGFLAQSAYAIPQLQYPNKWWDAMTAVATDAEAATANDETALKAILADYTKTIQSTFDPVELLDLASLELVGEGFTGATWTPGSGIAMTEASEGVWYTANKITFKEGDQMKVCGYVEGNTTPNWLPNDNYVVKASEAGEFYVKFVYNADTIAISLVAEK